MEEVTVRLTGDIVRLLQSLVDRGDFPKLSEVVRNAIDEFVGDRFRPGSIVDIDESAHDDGVIELSALVHGNNTMLMGEAVQDAVREYIRNRMDRG